MSQLYTLARLLLYVVLAVVLGRVVMAAPGLQTLSIPERGVSVTLPDSLEGWTLEKGQDNVLVRGTTRMGLASVEVVDTGLPQDRDVKAFIDEHMKGVRASEGPVILWEHGKDRFGRGQYESLKWTSKRTLAIWPFPVDYWSIDYYIPHRGTYLRVSLRYPDFMWRYFRPDRTMLASGLKLER